MYTIKFLFNNNGISESLEFIRSVATKGDKQNTVLSNKINDYITALSKFGLILGEPFIKHLDDDIWELRPKNVRFLFAVQGDTFVILNYFIKKSTKTPKHEIDLAKKRWKEYLEVENNEQ